MKSIKRHIYNPIAIAAVFLAVLIMLFGVLWILIPPPPKTIEMATGFPTGLYYQFGERLKIELAEDRIKLDVMQTGGSVDNLKLLADEKSEESGSEENENKSASCSDDDEDAEEVPFEQKV